MPADVALRPEGGAHDRRLYVRVGAHFIEAPPENVFEAARELIAERFYPRAPVLSDPDLVELFFRLQLGPRDRQVFAAAYLNARRRLVGYVELALGTVDQVEICPREVVREGLIRNATQVIFGRNNVCGTSEASLDDKMVFQRLRLALELVDIRALDYLIIGERTTSMNTGRRTALPTSAPRSRKRASYPPTPEAHTTTASTAAAA
jgi:DNA repair protein RadC